MILITGASAGIGEATARAFAQAGPAELLLLARRTDRLRALAEELTAKCGARVHAHALDVSDRAHVAAFASSHADLLARVEILVNNAGLARGREPIQRGRTEDWDEMIRTNVQGLLYVTHAILPHFEKRGSGHIVNLGSVAGRWTYPNGNVYAATKAAVHSLSQGMRYDLLGKGIRVTEISPGMVETEFSVVRFGDAAKAKAVYAGMEPLAAKDIADAIVWAARRPAHVNVQEIVLYPISQSSPTTVHRTT